MITILFGEGHVYMAPHVLSGGALLLFSFPTSTRSVLLSFEPLCNWCERYFSRACRLTSHYGSYQLFLLLLNLIITEIWFVSEVSILRRLLLPGLDSCGDQHLIQTVLHQVETVSPGGCTGIAQPTYWCEWNKNHKTEKNHKPHFSCLVSDMSWLCFDLRYNIML